MKIHAVGGYGLVGRNMTIYESDNDAVVVDMGLHLDNYIAYQEAENEKRHIDRSLLQKIGAVPDLRPVHSLKGKVRAIVITHGHLDHVGAVQFLEQEFDAPIIATPLTAAILRALAKDTRSRLKNRIHVVKQGARYKISDDLTIEFIRAAHSIPETSLIAFHTSKGVYLHASDFKFDDQPGVGAKTDVKRLSQLKGNVRAVVVDTLNGDEQVKTPSESVARELLKDVLNHKELEGKGIIVSTFSSHLSRLKTAYQMGKKLNRRVVFAGRSLDKYLTAGKSVGLVDFPDAEMIGFARKVRARLREIEKEGKEKYLIIATGHQGEPGSVLERIARGELKFRMHDNDAIVFSCSVIPAPQNIENRAKLEHALEDRNVRIFKDVHVSGHLSQEDHRFLFELVRPDIVIPTHSDFEQARAIMPMMRRLGYRDEQFVLLSEGEHYTVPH